MAFTATSPPITTPSVNRLLAALPADESASLLRQLVPVPLRHTEVLYQANEPITHVYFPTTALVSLMIVMADGTEMEMAAVGREGMAGLPVALGSDTDGYRAMTQIPGDAPRMEACAFRVAVAELPGLQTVLGRYALALLAQTGQAAVGNALHPIPSAAPAGSWRRTTASGRTLSCSPRTSSP